MIAVGPWARLAVLTLAVVSAAALGAGTLRPSGTGAEGIGDQYFPQAGNGGYDVERYDIELGYDPATDRLTGRTTVTATATAPLRQFDLDLLVPASEVWVDGRQASFTQDGGELRVRPQDPVAASSPMRIVVGYAGVPSTIPSPTAGLGTGGWLRTPDGATAVGEPDCAPWWFPSNNHPSDKAAVAVTVTVPDGVEVVSNGALLGGPEPVGSQRRWRWAAEAPMATYLAFVAIGQYDLVTRDTPFGPYLAAYQQGAPPAPMAAAREAVERTPEILDVLDDLLGPYPFRQVGGVVTTAGFPAALETQTRPVFGLAIAASEAREVVVHELAHQWFGDSVSLARWRDIWLNEGFATYVEWLYTERTGGRTAAATADLYYVAVGRPEVSEDFWRVRIADPGPADLFSSAVYLRGAMALHALRAAVGDQDFFTLLRVWTAERAGGNATVEDFLATAERVSGERLGEWARRWLYEPDRPPNPPSRTTADAPTTPPAPR